MTTALDRARPHTTSPGRLLLVLDDCGPGDALCVDFCLEAIRARYPESEIDLLVSKPAAPVFVRDSRFRSVIVSRVYEQRSRYPAWLSVKKLRQAIRLVRRLGRRYDMVVTFYWGTRLLNLLARWTSRGPSIGYENGWPWLLDSRLGRYPEGGDPVIQATRLLAAIGIAAVPAVATGRVEQLDALRALDLLDVHGLRASQPLVVLHTGSDWACQQWLPDRWAELADWLVEELDASVLFTGVLAEAGYIERIRRAMRRTAVSLAGATGIPELSALLARAALCVCVDSLAFELAQAVGVPTVVLAGQSRTKQGAPGGAPAIVVNQTAPELRAAILACKLTHVKASYGGCLHYACPMAGLRNIDLEQVMSAVKLAWTTRASVTETVVR